MDKRTETVTVTHETHIVSVTASFRDDWIAVSGVDVTTGIGDEPIRRSNEVIVPLAKIAGRTFEAAGIRISGDDLEALLSEVGRLLLSEERQAELDRKRANPTKEPS